MSPKPVGLAGASGDTARKAPPEKTRRPRGRPAKGTVAKAPAAEPGGERYVLRLYITGVSRTSALAVERVRAICEERFKGRYDLEVIDIYQLPALARGDQIVATPTLVRVLPAPLRRYIGDLSRDNVLFGIDLREKR